MRDIPEELAARIESGAATLCHVWLLSRRDGVKMGFTDHDRDLIVEGVTCSAGSGWTAGARENRVNSAGAASIAGVLDDLGIDEADLEQGLYDEAEVELWRVDWRRPDLKIRLWRGRLARVRRQGQAFTADLEGPFAMLERVIGRTFGRDCSARLGDTRCGVDVSAFPGASCDHRWKTCVERFGNGIRFRGFPDIPGDDFLTAMPTTAGRHDGGSRR